MSDQDLDLNNLTVLDEVCTALGMRHPTSHKLQRYLTLLKETGCALDAAASQCGLSYNTVIDARARSDEFATLEKMAHDWIVVDVDKTVAQDACTSGNVGAQALFYKRRGQLTERTEVIHSGDALPLEAYSPATRKAMLADQLAHAAKGDK